MKNPDLLTESYFYELDPKRIADRPVEGRHNSKLLVYNQATDTITHTHFNQISEFLKEDDLLVLNESKVFPCRLTGTKPTGGAIELFILSLIPEGIFYPVMIKSNSKKKLGDTFVFDELEATVEDRSNEGDFLVSFNLSHDELLNFLEAKAQIPIPPYIRGGVADAQDKADYQTVYAKNTGSVAAPTAGLHFTEKVFDSLNSKGIKKAFVNLHVGAGTFKPVNAENIKDHQMHKEYFDISDDQLDLINKHKNKIAVGTTSLRVLESCFENERIVLPNDKATSIFLHPGVEVKSISGLITNFHLPKSTLIMLVASLLGREKTLSLYAEAIKNDYRFFSYGDAMLILRDNYVG